MSKDNITDVTDCFQDTEHDIKATIISFDENYLHHGSFTFLDPIQKPYKHVKVLQSLLRINYNSLFMKFQGKLIKSGSLEED